MATIGGTLSGMQVTGLKEMITAFQKTGDESIMKLSDASVDAAQMVARRAKTLAPTGDTGNLKKNIKVSKPGAKNKKKFQLFSKVYLAKGGRHGVPVELGHRLVYFGQPTTKFIKAHPFLRPAADTSKEQVANMMQKAIDESLRKWGGR